MAYTPNLQLENGGFTDFEGNPLNAGYLLMELSHDENYSVGPNQVVGGLKLTITLNSTGNIPVSPATLVWSNDVLTPGGSFYIVRAFKSDGTEAWKSPQYWTLAASPNPLDVGTIVPQNPPSAGLSGGNTTLLLETGGAVNSNQSLLNLAAGTNVTIANVSGTTTISATGGGTYSTSTQGYFIASGMVDITSAFVNTFLAPMTNTTANVVVVNQFVLQSSWKLSSISYQFTSAGAGGTTVNFGIYNAAGSKLIDSGIFDGTSTSVQTNSFSPVTLAPGVYYFAVSATSSSIHGVVMQTAESTSMLAIISTSAPYIATAANATSGGVMPATLGTLTAITTPSFWEGIPLPIWKV